MDDLLSIFVVASWSLFLLAGILGLCNRKKTAYWMAWSGLGLLCAAAVNSWLQVQRLPVYGLFESNLYMALVLAVCVQWIGRSNRDADWIQSWGSLLVVVLLSLALLEPGKLQPNYYLYQFLSVQLFFFLRLSAGGVLMLAWLLYTRSWLRLLQDKQQGNAQAGLKPAVSVLLLGSILFLGSELAGTVWCALGWGDTWHWSQNFFESAAMFLLFMLPLHLPPWLKKSVRRAGTGSLCTLAVILRLVWP